jgi:GNAT superfamily N-acetyltransferase
MATIRRARPDEAAAISALALRSKAHWGYDEDFLEACRAELTYRPDGVRNEPFYVAEDEEGALAGFYRLSGTPPEGELAALFVEPHRIGTGLGGQLLRHALAQARRQGMEVLWLEADPGAEPFYAHAGFVRVGVSPSGSVPGRVLPRMRRNVSP